MNLKTILPVALLMFGCKGYQYAPTPQFIPLNEKKGELKGNISYNIWQAGYSFTNHFSLFVSGHIRPQRTSFTGFDSHDNRTSEKSYNADIGISYFGKTNYFIYEVLFGSGFGHIFYENTFEWEHEYEFDMSTDKFNFFIQPDIGHKVLDNLEIGLVSKFSMINYYNIKTSLNNPAFYETDPSDEYFIGRKRTSFLFAEPGLFVKAGGKHVKISAVISLNYNLDNIDINYQPGNIYLSAFLNFDLLKRKAESAN